MWEEIIFFKKHRIQSIKHLEGWGQSNQMVDGSTTAQDVVNDQTAKKKFREINFISLTMC